MGDFAIMNNTPTHFIASGIGLVIFVAALLTSDDAWKQRLRTWIMIVFALQIITGLFVWTLVPFSLALLTKSLGGLVLMWLLLRLMREPSNRTFWILTVLIAVVGLALAFFYI